MSDGGDKPGNEAENGPVEPVDQAGEDEGSTSAEGDDHHLHDDQEPAFE